MTDTARFADVLLPATTVFEQRELHKSYGHYFLQYSEPVIAPVGESLSNPELFARLAARDGIRGAGAGARATDELLRRRARWRRGTRSAASTRRACARDELARVRFGGADGADPVRHRLPDDRERQGRAVSAGARAGRATTPAPSALSAGAAQPGVATSDQLDLRRVQSARARRSHMHPDDAAARGISDGAVGARLQRPRRGARAVARARRGAAGRGRAAQGPVAIEHARTARPRPRWPPII